ncbi:MAG: hypothetical protein H6624_15550 [Bdellovibrionaceae bacterium]|nr:hypothetical protein [Pseudobdellovibrionaceae bacterium]
MKRIKAIYKRCAERINHLLFKTQINEALLEEAKDRAMWASLGYHRWM